MEDDQKYLYAKLKIDSKIEDHGKYDYFGGEIND